MPDSRATYFSSIDHASATQGYLQSAMDTHNSTVPTTPTTAGCDHSFEAAVPFNGRKRFAPEALAPGCSWLTTWFLGKKCSALLQAPISIPADVRCMFNGFLQGVERCTLDRTPTHSLSQLSSFPCSSVARTRGSSLLTNASLHDCSQSRHVHMRFGVSVVVL